MGMIDSIDPSEARALATALPGRIHEAAQVALAAERRLTRMLLYRATGNPVRGSKIAVARMALARTQRELEDLQRIQRLLPALLEEAPDVRQPEPAADVA